MSEPFRFVDAHVHFWDHSVSGLHWRYLEPGFDHPRLRGMHRLDAPIADLARIGSLAADCTARAIARGVYEADDLDNIPSYRSLYPDP